MPATMHDHEVARTARQQGDAPALSRLMAQMRDRYPGSKVLDVRTERRNGRLHYIFSLMDRNNRVHRVRVPLPMNRAQGRGRKVYNFNRNR